MPSPSIIAKSVSNVDLSNTHPLFNDDTLDHYEDEGSGIDMTIDYIHCLNQYNSIDHYEDEI